MPKEFVCKGCDCECELRTGKTPDGTKRYDFIVIGIEPNPSYKIVCPFFSTNKMKFEPVE